VLLDNGVSGIVFPEVNSAEGARRAAERCKSAPIGVAPSVAATPVRFPAVPIAEAMAQLNDATLVVCMIETRESLDNIAEIAAVEEWTSPTWAPITC
jgi:staphyloferrin B biosynthesis citrate synthase